MFCSFFEKINWVFHQICKVPNPFVTTTNTSSIEPFYMSGWDLPQDDLKAKDRNGPLHASCKQFRWEQCANSSMQFSEEAEFAGLLSHWQAVAWKRQWFLSIRSSCRQEYLSNITEIKWKSCSISVPDFSAVVEQTADNGTMHILTDIKLLPSLSFPFFLSILPKYLF